MSNYSGLDKVDLTDLTFVESYGGGKIYTDNNDGGFSVTKRKFLIDDQITSIDGAKQVIDHFNLD